MELTSIYKGGRTAQFVQAEIKNRFGAKEAEAYDPSKNCFTFKGWLQRGFVVKKGEKAIRSITFIKEKDKNGDLTGDTYPKNVFLFYKLQVIKRA